MKNVLRILRLLSDETRLRILMVLMRKELCVCQIMAVLGVSQPLISRNLALLGDSGLLNERREGKLVFYSLNKDIPSFVLTIIGSISGELKGDKTIEIDLEALRDCEEYQNRVGRCDMKTFLAFMKERREKKELKEER